MAGHALSVVALLEAVRSPFQAVVGFAVAARRYQLRTFVLVAWTAAGGLSACRSPSSVP